jgi:hypothetical protein
VDPKKAKKNHRNKTINMNEISEDEEDGVWSVPEVSEDEGQP